MNLKNVLRTYSLLRSLTDDESALLETLRGMNDAERELLGETLSPAKASKKPAKKSSSKSQRASGMAAAIGNSLRQRRVSMKGGDTTHRLCEHEYPSGDICEQPEAHAIHAEDSNDVLAHEFYPPRSRDLDDDPNRHCHKILDGGENGHFPCNEPADANVHHLRGATGYHGFEAGKAVATTGN